MNTTTDASATHPVEACDRVVFATRDVVLGEFRCPTTWPGFATAGRIHYHVVAFPRSAVWIERDDTPPFVADPSLATIYDPGRDYQRSPISSDGDRSDWLGVSASLARSLIRDLDPCRAEGDPLFRYHRAPVPAQLYRQQRDLFTTVTGEADPLEVEERTVQIMAVVLRSAGAGAGTGATNTTPARRSRRMLVEEARAAVLRRLFENVTLTDLARELNVSPFHLCHAFRAETGSTLHAYRRDVRLRVALGLAPDYQGNLSALALTTGFYSHSHFTAAFHRAFGTPPRRATARSQTGTEAAAIS